MSLHAQVYPDSTSVAFQTASGSTALTYGGLKSWDADGKNLLVRFEPAGETAIRIAVDDQSARYPTTIDPIAQQAYLKASNTGANDQFGYSVAVSGDTVVIGAFGAPVQNFDLSDLTLTRDNGPNLIDGSFSLATLDNTLFTLTLPAAITTPGGTYRLTVMVSNIVDLSGTPLGIGSEVQWLMLSTDQDSDGDGMNDASEFKMAPFGFDWQVGQPGLVSTYQNNANGAGYHSLSQVQALNSGTPLIQRNPATGKFKLTMDWRKSTDLATFTDFPAPAGSAVSVSPTGDIEVEFDSPDNAAFFRLGME